MDPIFLQALEDLHTGREHQEIIDIIEALPKHAQTSELIGLLARAYCNLGAYEHALDLLLSVRDPEDFIWNFRVGFAYYHDRHPAEALPYFEQAYLYHPTTEIAAYIKQCHAAEFTNKTRAAIRATKDNPIHNASKRKEETSSPPAELPVLNDPLPMEAVTPPDPDTIIRYLPNDLAAVTAHIEEHFGKIVEILPSNSNRAIDIGLCICPPNEKSNHYTIVTLGMGALPMHIPEDRRTRIPARTELVMTLPADWKFDLSDHRWVWPLHWLLVTAYLPFDENTWIDVGHSLSTSAENLPFDTSTRQSCILTVDLQDHPKAASMCPLPDGETVRFLQVLALYPEELVYKMQYGTRALLRQMSNTEPTICPYRLNTCTPDLLYPSVNPSPYLC